MPCLLEWGARSAAATSQQGALQKVICACWPQTVQLNLCVHDILSVCPNTQLLPNPNLFICPAIRSIYPSIYLPLHSHFNCAQPAGKSLFSLPWSVVGAGSRSTLFCSRNPLESIIISFSAHWCRTNEPITIKMSLRKTQALCYLHAFGAQRRIYGKVSCWRWRFTKCEGTLGTVITTATEREWCSWEEKSVWWAQRMHIQPHLSIYPSVRLSIRLPIHLFFFFRCLNRLFCQIQHMY